MIQVKLDPELKNKLLNLEQPIEFCDESGQVVGRFFPIVDVAKYEPWEPPIDEEELRRREQSKEKRYTTTEVLSHLEKL